MLAVGREGLETALFLWAATQAGTREPAAPSPPTGAAARRRARASRPPSCSVTSIYRGAVWINLSRFFTWTGALLIVVAAGVLAYGMHDLQEAASCPASTTWCST